MSQEDTFGFREGADQQSEKKVKRTFKLTIYEDNTYDCFLSKNFGLYELYGLLDTLVSQIRFTEVERFAKTGEVFDLSGHLPITGENKITDA
jgi:hypothetical protein